MKQKLMITKLIHTIIWLFFVIDILYIVYAGLFNKISYLVWLAIILVVFEGIVLLLNKGKCPITSIAYKYSGNHDIGFDIYVPKFIIKYNTLIFTTIFIIGVLLVIC